MVRIRFAFQNRVWQCQFVHFGGSGTCVMILFSSYLPIGLLELVHALSLLGVIMYFWIS
jgi:hypothetical protein